MFEQCFLFHYFFQNLSCCPDLDSKYVRIEEKITDQKYLSISSLQTDYLNLDSISGFGINSEISNTVQKKCPFCGGVNQSADRKRKKILRLVIRTTDEVNGRLGNVLYVDLKITYLINLRSHYNRECENGKNNSDQKIYAYMARMSSNDERSSENYGDNLQLTKSKTQMVNCKLSPNPDT